MNSTNINSKQALRVMGALKLCTGSRQVFVNDSEMNLTGLEFNLLNLLMMSSPDLLLRATINIHLFKGAANKEQTLNMHISNLRKKLLKCSSGLGIQSMRGQGYYLVLEEY